EAHGQEQIAIERRLGALAALPAQTHPGAGDHARWDCDLKRAARRDRAAPPAHRAGFGGAHQPGLAAALLMRDDAGAAAIFAAVLGGELDAHLRAAHRVAQRHLDLGLDVAAARRFLGEFVTAKSARAACAARRKSAAQAAEKMLEEIAEAAVG